jgi:hypothetical protein
VRSLSESASGRLFAERAQAADAEFRIGPADEASVGAICQRLDGIPLAIEMAAARAPTLGCERLLQRLDDRFRLLTGGRRTALPRQRTLIATLDWSHDLLSERDAAAFRRLGVFSGGFTLDAAAAVCACERWDGLEVAEATASLVAKSLVAPETVWDARRYRLLETTRAYALDKLAAAGETQSMQQAHAAYFRRLAAQSTDDFWLKPVSDIAFAERYFAEVDNFARAIDWAFGPDGDVQTGGALVADTAALMQARSLYVEFAAWAEQALLQSTAETPPAVRARLLAGQALIHTWISSTKEAELAEAAIEACRAADDALSLFIALVARSAGLMDSGRDQEAVPYREELSAMGRQFPSPSRVSANVKASTWRMALALDPQTPPDQVDRAIADFRSFGAEGMALTYRLFRLMLYPSHVNEAIEAFRALLADVRGSFTQADSMSGVVAAHLTTLLAARNGPNDLDEATDLARRYAHIEDSTVPLHLAAGLGWVALRTGRAPAAARLAGRLRKVTADMGRAGNPGYRRLFETLSRALQHELPEAELEQLMAEGASLTANDARRLVLGD